MKFKAAVGFRHVLDLLSSEKKLIVGHNCFLGTKTLLEYCCGSSFCQLRLFLIIDCYNLADLAHVYSKFFGPLPSTAEEFVSAVQKYFPCIIDTKVLLNSNDALLRIMKRGSTSLSKAFHLLCSQSVVNLTNRDLGNVQSVRVEVQVDNQRLVFILFFLLI